MPARVFWYIYIEKKQKQLIYLSFFKKTVEFICWKEV